MSDSSSRLGIERLGFNPHLSAISAWLSASGVEPSLPEIERLLFAHFEAFSTPTYVERFQSVQSVTRTQNIEEVRTESQRMLQEAGLEAEAALRKLVVSTTPRGSFRDDADFDSDPVYARALSIIGDDEAAAGSMAHFDLARCPHCRLVGEVETWFGRRRVSGRSLKQSWCRVCRSSE